MSNKPSAPIINIKPKASNTQLEFYWQKPVSTGINDFTPAAISSLQLWIDATDSTTMTVIDGNDVREVRDKVNGTIFIPKQDINGHFLRLQTNQINNNNVLWFDNQFADNVFLQTQLVQPNQAPSLSQTGCAFLLFKAQQQFTPARRPFFGTDTMNTPSFIYVNGLDNVVAPALSKNTAPGIPVNTLIVGDIQLIYIAWSGNTTKIGLYGNEPVSGFNPAPVQTPGNILNIGSDGALCNNLVLGEFLTFSTTLTTLERQQMEGYLAWKWGINSQLPYNHPYWNNDPRQGIAPLQGYVLSCPQIPIQLRYPASTSHALVASSSIQIATDYTFSLTAFNLTGMGVPAFYQITEQGLLPGGASNVAADLVNPSTVNVTWTFSTNTGEAITKWFVIKAVPNLSTNSTILKSVFGTERNRAITLTQSDTYKIIVQAVNDVGYSYPNNQNTTTITVP
jgi:hypothetical protein